MMLSTPRPPRVTLWPVGVILAAMLIPSCWAVCSEPEPAYAFAANRYDLVVAGAVECGATEWLAHELLHLEQLAGVSEEFVGMSLAAACHESKFAPHVIAGIKRGDDRRARGLVQVHGWAKKACGLDAPPMCGAGYHDPVALAECWLGNIRRLAARAERDCGSGKTMRRWDRSSARGWKAAWAWGASGAKGYRCRAPRHVDVLEGWSEGRSKR